MANDKSMGPIQLIAFGVLAALVIIALLVPAGAAAGVVMLVIGYTLGLGNPAIGVLALAAWIPAGALAIRWIWPDLREYSRPTGGRSAQ